MTVELLVGSGSMLNGLHCRFRCIAVATDTRPLAALNARTKYNHFIRGSVMDGN